MAGEAQTVTHRWEGGRTLRGVRADAVYTLGPNKPNVPRFWAGNEGGRKNKANFRGGLGLCCRHFATASGRVRAAGGIAIARRAPGRYGLALTRWT